MKSKTIRLAVLVLAALPTGLTGCTSTIHTTSALGGVNVLSIDAKQRLVLQRTDKNGHSIVCAEPSPDAVVAQAAVLSASGAFRGATGSPSGNAAAGGGLQESVASIGLRTQSIQILRDGYYRMCEAYMNGAIDGKEYNEVVRNLDTFINIALAIDGLSKPIAAPAISIGTGNVTLGANASTPAADGAAASAANTNGQAGTETVGTDSSVSGGITQAPQAKAFENSGGASTERTAAAVAQIVRDYLGYKEDYLCVKNKIRCERQLNGNDIPAEAWNSNGAVDPAAASK